MLLTSSALAQTDVEIQKRLNEVEANRASGSATTSADKKSSYSFVEGTIVSTSTPVLVIETALGPKTIYGYESTKYINIDNSGKKLIGFGDLKIGEKILVIGPSRESSSGVSKMIVRDTSSKVHGFALLSKFAETKDNALYLKDFNRGDLAVIKVGLKTETLIKQSGKNISPEQLKLNQALVTVGTIDDKGNLIASESLVLN